MNAVNGKESAGLCTGGRKQDFVLASAFQKII